MRPRVRPTSGNAAPRCHVCWVVESFGGTPKCQAFWSLKPFAETEALIGARRHLQLEILWHVEMKRPHFGNICVQFLEKKLNFKNFKLFSSCTRSSTISHCIAQYCLHRCVADSVYATPQVRGGAARLLCTWNTLNLKKNEV